MKLFSPLLLACCVSTTTPIFSQSMTLASPTAAENEWVDATYQSLCDTQRIGQLFMIRAHSNLGSDHIANVENLIRTYQVGGLCFFQGTPERQAELTNQYQQISNLPLMVSMDAEWGVSMRLKETCIAFPKQLMLGAIQDNSLLYRFGSELARQCKRLGVQVNFAPVADVNNNPNNPVINERSFGEDKYNVSTKAFEVMRGMQDNGVMACAKHFPGHGDTDVDSHYDLPLVNHDISRLTLLEMMPFRVLSQKGIMSMMAAHLQIPAIDATSNLPTSLSKKAVTDILRTDIGFDGLVFTDGLEMKGVTKYYSGGEVEAKAIAAGNDVLLLPESVPMAFQKIKAYIQMGMIDTIQLERSVKRVLHAKYQLGLTTKPFIDVNNIRADINSPEAVELKRLLIQNALTLVRNDDQILPLRSFQTERMASISIGTSTTTIFQRQMAEYAPMAFIQTNKDFSENRKQELYRQLQGKDTVIVSLHDLSSKADKDFGLTNSMKSFVNELAKRHKVILVVFGNPYALKYFDGVNNTVVAYNEDRNTQELTAQAIFGAFEMQGKLPITASFRSRCGWGVHTEPLNRLQFNETPEAVGFNTEKLQRIDNIANEVITSGTAPSCQILVARKGQVIYNKAFGNLIYEKDSLNAATTETLYDLASVTKVGATTLALMKLYEEGRFDPLAHFGDYLPILKGSNKENLLMRDVLIHQAGLKEWIPFYKNTVDAVGKPLPQYYSALQTDEYSIQVADNLYMKKDYIDSIKNQIIATDLKADRGYHYSDLGMILMKDVIDNLGTMPFADYVQQYFYRPLGMGNTLFNPRQRYDISQIAPTEDDRYFRQQRIQGYVHDMGAAMLGGVSGHAGLFSNATDMAILFQMLLNGGEYGGVRYLRPETVRTFTTRQAGSTRRGLGFDMKELNTKKKENMSPLASRNTFGHTGFTGNCIWADPDKELIYIFLSNRTYPTAENNKLINGDYRLKIHTAIYEAMVE